MKKNIFKFLVVLLSVNVLITSCDKDDNIPATPDKVKKMMFDWKITAITVPKKTDASVDSSIIKTCSSDDLIKFNSSGFDFQDGTTKCDTSIFYYSKGAWSYDLTNDSIKLSATNPTKYMSWKVLTLNDSILKVKFIDSTNTANKLTKTVSFKH